MKKTIKMLITLVAMGIAGVNYGAVAQAAVHDAATTATTSVKINLNTADAATILKGAVKGIGVKRAQAIVDYRNQHGSYQSFQDLAKVKGIGESFVKSHLAKLSEVFSLS